MQNTNNTRCPGCGRSHEYIFKNNAYYCTICNTRKYCLACKNNNTPLFHSYCCTCRKSSIQIPKSSYGYFEYKYPLLISHQSKIFLDRACKCGGNYPYQPESGKYLHCVNCKQMYSLISCS